jgi:energy-coupling factor transport system ATP-binding protein
MSIALEHVNYIYSPGTAYEKRALNDISLEIGQGQFVGIIGHTGSGKSTLIQHLNGLMKATSGDILYDGQSIYAEGYDMRKLRSQVGLVFQYPEHQLFEVDVISDVCFGPKNQGLSAMKPKVLILDEPTAGLDPKGRDEILDQIAKLHKETGMTVVLVSHSMEDVARYVDRIIVMNKGEKMLDSTPKEVFRHYKELEEVGLAAPQVTYVMHDLKDRGFDVSPDATTIEEAADEIMRSFI